MSIQLHGDGCTNPSGKLLVQYTDEQPRHRYMFCQDCHEFLFMEVLDELEPVPPHPANCIHCQARSQ